MTPLHGILLCMMGYGYGGMVGGGTLGIVTWLVVVIDLILLGVFLWQRIEKK